ncbi:hypothetical protein [Bernardetia sp.]|uniref:hypothetical protein n=1 Tax=Bernardetia sp. TaxID=1937974 RepID=UPI0025B91A09|nr:hypothetical protein [Bernardetia sp.]
MKKIKSIYILFVFAAISSYGFWACTGTGSETTSETDATKVEEVEEPDTRPASAASDTSFYIKATINEKEYVFNYTGLDNKPSYNLKKDNLFRIERCADDHCKENLYIQAVNFDMNQEAPFTLTETSEEGKVKDIIFNFTITNNKGKYKNQWQDNGGFEMTIEKIEGDIYEGTFKGKVLEQNTKGISDVVGSFRIKMVVRKPVA